MTSRLQNLDLIASAPDGVKKGLRELILELAVRGKLVPQDPNDEPASELLKRIQAEKAKLVAEGKIKKNKPLPEIGEDEKPFGLPVGWEWVRFGDVLDFQGGGQPPKSKFTDTCLPEHVQLIQIRDLGPNPQPVYVHRDTVSKFCTPLDIMVGRYGASVGKIFWGKDGAYNVALVKMIDLHEAFDSRFLFELLRSPLGQSYFSGISRSAQDGFNKNDIEINLIPLLPKPEQHRIVAKLDELMALCDQLEVQQTGGTKAHATLVKGLLDSLTQSQSAADFITQWQRIAHHFDTLFTTETSIDALKQTILQLAVMGKLVPQDPNDEPASELLKRIQAEKARLVAEGKLKKDKPLPAISEEEKSFELPVGWEWVRVGQLSELVTSGSRDWAQHYAENGAIFVRMGNLTRNGYDLRMNNIQHIQPPSDSEGSRTRLSAGDLLVSITGDVGLLGLIPEGFGEAYVNQHTCVVRLMLEVKNRYLPEVFRSPLAKKQFDAPQRGIKNSFRLTDITEMVIPLAPLPEQHRIVAKVDELMALCDQLASQLKSAREVSGRYANAATGAALNAA